MDATTLNDDDVINDSQAAELFAACSAIMMLINSGVATNKTLRTASFNIASNLDAHLRTTVFQPKGWNP